MGWARGTSVRLHVARGRLAPEGRHGVDAGRGDEGESLRAIKSI